MGVIAEKRVLLGRARELGLDGSGDVDDGLADPRELVVVEALEDGTDQVAPEDIDVAEESIRGVGLPDQDDAAVVRKPDPLDVATLLEAIDDPGRVGERHIEQLGDPAHRHRTVMPEHREHVEMGHADPELHETLRADALELRERLAELGDEGLHRLAPVWFVRFPGDVLHVVNYRPWGNRSVKTKYGQTVEEFRCAWR